MNRGSNALRRFSSINFGHLYLTELCVKFLLGHHQKIACFRSEGD